MGLDQRLAEYRQTLKHDFVAGVEAARFLVKMEEDHPEELEEWLRTHALRFVAEALGRQLNAERSAKLRSATAASFAHAAASGDPSAMSIFGITFVVDPKHTRRRFGEMRGPDCLFVAERYEVQGRRELALASFMRAVAKTVGDRTVEEVIPPARLSRMLQSLLGPDKGDDDILARLAATA